MTDNFKVSLRRSDFILVSLSVLYIAQIPSPFLQAAFTAIVVLYLFFSLLWNKDVTFHAITQPRGHLITALLIYLLYVIFAMRESVHQDPIPLLKALTYGLTHLMVFLAIQVYGAISRDHAIRLVRAFAFSLLLSLLVYAVGLLYPVQLFALRYIMYGNIYEQLESGGVLGTGALNWSAGLAPYLHIFGYQAAGGAAIALAMFMTSYRNRLLAGMLALFSCAMVIILAQRSILPALAVALIALLRFRINAGTGFQENRINTRRLVVMFLIVAASMPLASGLMTKYYQDEEIKLVQERVASEDLWVRLGMQAAAVEIIATHPAGLVMDGLAEEDWGALAEARGYEVVPDANQVDYALVHNAYLRIIMYLGWTAGVLILAIFTYLFRRIFSMAGSFSQFPCKDIEHTRHAVAAATVFVALVVQSMFHNDSIFTFERTSWASLCILFAIFRHLPKEIPAR